MGFIGFNMGQTSSVPSRRRKSFKSLRSPFPRRSNSHQGSLSATFSIPENEQKHELLNINVASEEELMTLPEITRQIAQNIVEHRRVIGRFKKVEDLALVSGIGADKLHKIKYEISVGKKRTASCNSSRAQSLDSLKSADSVRLGFKGSQKSIDINKGNCFDFMTLHGITQELAANIVHYRDKKGPFTTIDNLLKVKGIDSLRLGAIRNQLTINSSEEDLTIEKAKDVLQNNGNLVTTVENHTPRHRKSLSAPIKFSLSLGNGLSKAPIDDIFDLLSAYSYRPIVEEEFRYERNGKKAIRIATWNLDRLCLEKAENLGFREVVCRTILENRFSVIAIQDILDVAALKLICDELNKPTLRRIFEWKDNSREWNYCFSDAQLMLSQNKPGVGFIYDTQSELGIKFLSVKELPKLNSTNCKKSEAAIGRFCIDDTSLSIVNIYVHSEEDCKEIDKQIKEFISENNDSVVMVGDFTALHKQIDNLTNSTFTHILPLSINTSSMTPNSHHTQLPRYFDNIFLTACANEKYTGVSGIVRQGLTHMAIPRGWTWGGPASEHCPIWFEIFTQQNKNEMIDIDEVDNKNTESNKIEIIFGDTVVNDVVNDINVKNENVKSDILNGNVKNDILSDIDIKKSIVVDNDNKINKSIINGGLNKKDILVNGIVKNNVNVTESNGKCCTDI